MLTASQDERIPASGTLLPRYRRVLSFGDVLDESIRLFRQHWIAYALMSAVSLVPPGLFGVWLSASGRLLGRSVSLADLQNGRFAQAPAPDLQVGALVATSIVSAFFYFIWSPAISATTEAYLRGGEPSVARVYRRALRRFFAVFFGTVLFSVGMSALAGVAVVLFVVTVFGVLGSSVAVVALLFWWLRPGARKNWVKWLIILCAPFGLPTYFGVRWSMYIAAAVLERRGPLASLSRSAELVDRQGFRVLSILTVSSLIVGVLLYGPATLIEIPLMIGSGSFDYGSQTEAAVTEAARVVLQILFGSIGVIVYTLMFVDLRNRREGTDMAERLTQLEASPITPGG